MHRIAALAVLCAFSMVCTADDRPDTQSELQPAQVPTSVTLLEADFNEPFLPWAPDELWTAVLEREHETVLEELSTLDRSQLSGRDAADLAFLEAWTLLRADRGSEGAMLIEVIRRAETVPQPYILLTVGELLLATDRPVEAAATLAEIPEDVPIWTRAQLQRAEALQAAGQTEASLSLYESLAAQPDPTDGMPQALWALANRKGLQSPEAYPYLRRLWAMYPRSREGRNAARQLSTHEARGSGYRPTRLEIAQHGDALMRAWSFESTNNHISSNLSRFTEADPASCMAWYAHGRSHFKRNNVTLASEILSEAGRNCVGIDDDRGAKALYIAGKALERKKQWAAAARVYQDIPRLYPEHTMADDGYTLAGIGWQESGDLERAMNLWAQQVSEYPQGDLAAEGFWRLAWNSYRQGHPDDAISWAEQMAWTVDVQSDPVHVLAGMYWAARWKLYPDINNPTVIVDDEQRVADGIRDLTALCMEHPTSFYALLAAARLAEVAPQSLSGIPRPTFSGEAGEWTLTSSLAAQPAMQRALALSQLGLVQESLDELSQISSDDLGPTGMAIRARIQSRRNPVEAHDALHKYLLHHPPSTFTANQIPILQTAYPNLYWDEVTEAATGYGYDPRIFHALVREESSFNKDIVSWAGARGLSQLMPATARRVGEWLDINVTRQSSFDPLTNLRIGSRYMEFLQDRFRGNMFLAVGGYNAGEGNIDRWLRERGNTPTDEFVENIPFRETRSYVKRVMGTYQVYHVLYDEDPLFSDWSPYNHRAKPSQ